ncbi:MAG TPA: GEVED domain-containing protein [Edaphocola sp.]|nr:GEVED domain-containing protein [Edaphocola sp.]
MTRNFSKSIKGLALASALALGGSFGYAQTTIQIGSGSGTSSYLPIYTYYGYNYTQTIYTAAEMNAQGATAPSTISKIWVLPTFAGSSTNWKDWVVYMGNTSKDGFSGTSDWVSSSQMTQVFNDTIISNTIANDWIELTLSTPFVWDGSSNIVVAFDENTPAYGSSGQTWAGYTLAPSSGSKGIYYYNDPNNIDPAAPPTASSVTNTVAQIKFTYTPLPGCTGTPVAGTASGPVGTICPNNPLSISLSGTTLASGLTFQWQSTPAGGSTWTNIAGATSANYSNASGITASTDYRVIVTCTAGNASDTSNTVAVSVAPLFPGGTYTINPALPASSTNFQTMGAAVSAISCGISGPIVFNMAAGNTFNEQVTIPSTLVTSATNTVTFNGNGDTVKYSGTSSQPWTIGLDGADYFTFNNLVVQGESNYALAMHLWNGADHNNFNNCTFMTPENGTNSTQVPFSVSGSATSGTTAGNSGSYNTVDSCTMYSGYYNTVFAGDNSNNSFGNQVLNSTLKDFYFYGSYNTYQTGMLVKGNTVERPTRTTVSSFYGIYFSTGVDSSTIENNRIQNQFGGNPTSSSSTYNIYVNSTATGVGTENRIINNVIGNVNGKSTVYGIYLPSAIHTQVYYNTISLDNTAATSGSVYGIYSTGTSGGIDIKNNNISITQGGSGTKYCLYFSSSANGKSSNNNNLYMGSTSGTNNIGYLSGAQATMAAWQAAGGGVFDQNSVSVDPMFSGASSGNFTPTNAMMNDLGVAIAGITTDFTGATRSATTPDMGAYEFSVGGCSGTPLAGTAYGPALACPSQSFTIADSGFSVAGGITFQWEEQTTTGGAWTAIAGATQFSYNVPGITAPTSYRLKVTCTSSNITVTSNSFLVGMNTYINCYCVPAPPANGCSGDNIASVSLNTLSDPSLTCTPIYEDRSSVQNAIPNLTTGTSPSMSVGVGTGGTEYVGVWIDYNQNGIFDSSEYTALGSGNGIVITNNLLIPANALGGNTKMRVRSQYNSAFAGTGACSSISFGSTRDYLVNIVVAVVCSGTIDAGTASAPTSICAGNSFTVNVTGNSAPATNLVGNWQSAPSPTGPWTDITGATLASYSVSSGISSATSFRYWMTCSANSSSDTSNVVTVTLNPATQCYCTPVYSTGCSFGDDISNVTLNGNTTNINNSTTTCSPNAYGNFTSLNPADLYSGSSYNLSVSTSYSSPGSEKATAWIDYNQNGIFDTNEVIYNAPNGLVAGGLSQSFIVPSGQAPGSYRMRVRVIYSGTTPLDPCAAATYGETEDYMVQIVAGCTNPIALNLGNDTAICSGNTLTLNAATAGHPNATYVWSNASTAATLNVTNSGTYSVTVTDGACTATDTIVVTTAANPTVNLGADTSFCAGNSITLDAGTGGTYLWNNGASTQTITVNTSGTYSVVKTNTAGCSKSDTVVVTVDSLPIVDLGGDVDICEGDTAILDAGAGAASYLWNTGATTQTITVSTDGVYSVVVTNNNGCVASDSMEVEVDSLPTVAGITVTGTSPMFNFTANNTNHVDDYSWNFGDGSSISSDSNPSHTYAVVGNDTSYTVTLIVSNDCGSDTATVVVAIQGNSIKGFNLDANTLKLYPNPTSQTVTIDNNSGFKMKNIIITNVLGQQVMKIAVKSNKQVIDVAQLISGLYQVTVEFEEGIVTRKLEVIK